MRKLQPPPPSPPSPPSPTPTEALSTLSASTRHSTILSTLTRVLTSWHSGHLSHTHPASIPHLPHNFLTLLSTLPTHPWHSLDPPLVQFLQHTLLNTLIHSPRSYHASLPGVISLLETRAPTRATHAAAAFLVLRMREPGGMRQWVLRDAQWAGVVSEQLVRLLPLVAGVIDEDARTLPEVVKPAAEVLHELLVTCTTPSLQKHASTIRELLHPLLEHPAVETRLPALEMFRIFSDRCGVAPASVPYLRTSLLWNDPSSVEIGVPLLVAHLPGLEAPEKRAVEKLVLESVVKLSTAYKERFPCAESARVVVRLLPCVEGLVTGDGVRFVSAMGAFLGRVGVMVAGGRLEEKGVVSVCEAVVKGVRRCWIGCEGFRAEVFKGCLICFMEIEDGGVGRAVKDVVLTLAKCSPGRMRRLVRDVRESVRGLAGMGRVVAFLKEVEEEFVDVKEMKRVETGRLVERFFPEVNEFNI